MRLDIHLKILFTIFFYTCTFSGMDTSETIFAQLPDLLAQNNLQQLQTLISRDNIHINDPGHNNVLHYAAAYGTADACKIFIDYGATGINQKNYDGNTPLHYAVSTDNISMTKLFLKQDRVDVNVQNNMGNAPLQAAIQRHWDNIIGMHKKNKETQELILKKEENIITIIKCLLKRGAKQSIVNNKGKRIDKQIEINGSESREDLPIYKEPFTLSIHSLLLHQRLSELEEELARKEKLRKFSNHMNAKIKENKKIDDKPCWCTLF